MLQQPHELTLKDLADGGQQGMCAPQLRTELAAGIAAIAPAVGALAAAITGVMYDAAMATTAAAMSADVPGIATSAGALHAGAPTVTTARNGAPLWYSRDNQRQPAAPASSLAVHHYFSNNELQGSPFTGSENRYAPLLNALPSAAAVHDALPHGAHNYMADGNTLPAPSHAGNTDSLATLRSQLSALADHSPEANESPMPQEISLYQYRSISLAGDVRPVVSERAIMAALAGNETAADNDFMTMTGNELQQPQDDLRVQGKATYGPSYALTAGDANTSYQSFSGSDFVAPPALPAQHIKNYNNSINSLVHNIHVKSAQQKNTIQEIRKMIAATLTAAANDSEISN